MSSLSIRVPSFCCSTNIWARSLGASNRLVPPPGDRRASFQGRRARSSSPPFPPLFFPPEPVNCKQRDPALLSPFFFFFFGLRKTGQILQNQPPPPPAFHTAAISIGNKGRSHPTPPASDYYVFPKNSQGEDGISFFLPLPRGRYAGWRNLSPGDTGRQDCVLPPSQLGDGHGGVFFFPFA